MADDGGEPRKGHGERLLEAFYVTTDLRYWG